MEDPTTESAKAAQEATKTTAKAIDAAREVGAFVARLVAGSLEAGMGIFEDKLKYMRWERQQRLIVRSEEFLHEIGLERPTRAIPMKLAVPLLQAATLEEDDELQDLWCKLLVNSAADHSGVDLRRVYIDMLERITPLEAKILDTVYALPFDEMHHAGVLTADLPGRARVATEDDKHEPVDPSEEIKLALASLGSIDALSVTLTMGGGQAFESVNPTILGKGLVDACTLRPG